MLSGQNILRQTQGGWVEVTFRRADKLGLRSLAIPAISSGKLCDDEIYMNLLNVSYHKMASSGLWEQLWGQFLFIRVHF